MIENCACVPMRRIIMRILLLAQMTVLRYRLNKSIDPIVLRTWFLYNGNIAYFFTQGRQNQRMIT